MPPYEPVPPPPADSERLFNRDIVYPDDLYMLLVWTLGWAVLHAGFKGFIKPIARALVARSQVSDSAEPAKGRDVAFNPDAKHGKDHGLRARRPSEEKLAEALNGAYVDRNAAATSLEPNTVVTTTATETTTLTNSRSRKATPDNTLKFSVSAWKFTNFTIVTLLGIWVLSQEPWTLQPELYMKGYPEDHRMSRRMNLYYSVSFGSCLYMLVSIFTDPKQKDFAVMMIHHLTTIAIIGASYALGFFRIGSVILLLHDICDPFMEVAKLFLYMGNQKLADVFFLLFALVFLVMRNFLFPFYVISSPILYGRHADGRLVPFGRADLHYFCVGCLCVLECLHVYWAYLILKMAYKAVVEKKVEGDIRDEDEED
ncbi:hypothetical protein HK101_002251 [Irineochytrium annulatum]|nr:hypothetical protein HK101_002251 [Irineochytrium annulatum]